MAGVFDKIGDALSGRKPTQSADPGALNKKGYGAPMVAPPSVQAARKAMMDRETGIQGAMGAHADLVHPVKNGSGM